MTANRNVFRASPEFSLLVQCVSRARGLTPGPEFREVSLSPIDWPKFLALAERHKSSELVCRGFSEHSDLVDFPGREQLHRTCLAKRAARQMLLREWGIVVRELEASGTILYTLKGPALSLQLYGDPESREYKDLDFFVTDDVRVNALSGVFRRLGYETEIERRTAFAEPSHLTAWKIGRPVYLEIHGRKAVDFRHYYTISTDSLVKRSIPIRWCGATYRTFSLDDHGLYFLAHGTRHGWPVLSWLADAAVFFQQSLDWNVFWRMCRNTGMERIALFSLYTARRLFHLPHAVPGALLRYGDSAIARQASSIVYTYLIDKVPQSRKRYWMLRKTLFFASRMHRAPFFKYSVLRRLFSPRVFDARSMGIGDSLAFLLWFLHPLLVLFRIMRQRLVRGAAR